MTNLSSMSDEDLAFLKKIGQIKDEAPKKTEPTAKKDEE